MCMGVLPERMRATGVASACGSQPEEGVGCPGTGVTDSYSAVWVPEIEPGSPVRAASALNRRAFFPNPSFSLWIIWF